MSRVSVIDCGISEAEHDRITAEQIAYVVPLIKPLLTGEENIALDFGCGAGRFTAALRDLVGRADGYEPRGKMLDLAPDLPGIMYSRISPSVVWDKYGLVFVWCVLGGIDKDDLPGVARELAAVLAPRGLLILADHMPDEPPHGTAWTFRPRIFYEALFHEVGIELTVLGQCMQYRFPMDIMWGRHPE